MGICRDEIFNTPILETSQRGATCSLWPESADRRAHGTSRLVACKASAENCFICLDFVSLKVGPLPASQVQPSHAPDRLGWFGLQSWLVCACFLAYLISPFPAKIIRSLLYVSQERLVLRYGYFVPGSYLSELSFKLSGILRAMKKNIIS